MKANNGSGNNPDRDEWKTPRELFKELDQQYEFKFDCCATKENTKCDMYSDDFLKDNTTLYGVWMNPPFSKAKEMFEHFFKVVAYGVAIYRCDNLETQIWQDIILLNSDWIFFPKGRVCYEGLDGKGSRFPSALIGKGVKPPIHVKGICLSILGGIL